MVSSAGLPTVSAAACLPNGRTQANSNQGDFCLAGRPSFGPITRDVLVRNYSSASPFTWQEIVVKSLRLSFCLFQ